LRIEAHLIEEAAGRHFGEQETQQRDSKQEEYRS